MSRPGPGWPARLVQLAALLVLSRPAAAETLRPLRTEDVVTLENREIEAQLGFEYSSRHRSPVGPAEGDIYRFPVVGVNFGVGGRCEIQLRAPLYQTFTPESGERQSASGDLTIATKVRFFGGRGVLPGLGARALVKLPSVPETTGLGSDETDVVLEILTGLELAGATVAGSLGLAILGDPTAAASQNDKIVLGAGFILPLGPVDLAADLHGQLWGEGAAPDDWTALVGVARRVGRFRLDAAAGSRWLDERNGVYLSAGATFLTRFPARQLP